MGNPAKRGRGDTPGLLQGKGVPLPARRPVRILLHRLQQGCYGICAGAFVAIPAAMLGEHTPSARAVAIMAGVALFAGAMGMLIEVVESRLTSGDNDAS